MTDDSRYGRLSRAENFTRQARALLDGTGLWNTQHGRAAQVMADHPEEGPA